MTKKIECDRVQEKRPPYIQDHCYLSIILGNYLSLVLSAVVDLVRLTVVQGPVVSDKDRLKEEPSPVASPPCPLGCGIQSFIT